MVPNYVKKETGNSFGRSYMRITDLLCQRKFVNELICQKKSNNIIWVIIVPWVISYKTYPRTEIMKTSQANVRKINKGIETYVKNPKGKNHERGRDIPL